MRIASIHYWQRRNASITLMTWNDNMTSTQTIGTKNTHSFTLTPSFVSATRLKFHNQYKCEMYFCRYTVGRTMQLSLYVLDIVTDVGVAVTDYRTGEVSWGVFCVLRYVSYICVCMIAVSLRRVMQLCIYRPIMLMCKVVYLAIKTLDLKAMASLGN